MQYILSGMHDRGERCSPREARRERRQDSSIHNFSQLLKVSSSSGSWQPQPRRLQAACKGIFLHPQMIQSRQLVLAFLTHKGQIFLSPHLHHRLSRKQKRTDRQRPCEKKKCWNLSSLRSFAVDTYSTKILQETVWNRGEGQTPCLQQVPGSRAAHSDHGPTPTDTEGSKLPRATGHKTCSCSPLLIPKQTHP